MVRHSVKITRTKEQKCSSSSLLLLGLQVALLVLIGVRVQRRLGVRDIIQCWLFSTNTGLYILTPSKTDEFDKKRYDIVFTLLPPWHKSKKKTSNRIWHWPSRIKIVCVFFLRREEIYTATIKSLEKIAHHFIDWYCPWKISEYKCVSVYVFSK